MAFTLFPIALKLAKNIALKKLISKKRFSFSFGEQNVENTEKQRFCCLSTNTCSYIIWVVKSPFNQSFSAKSKFFIYLLLIQIFRKMT